MSENNVNGITGADVATTTGIIGATVGIGQYIINDYVITIAPIEGDYGYTMTITRGTETQAVALYGLTSEQYDAMLGYLQQAQQAAQSAQTADRDAQAALSRALNAALAAAESESNAAEQASESLEQAGFALQSANNALAASIAAQSAQQQAQAAQTAAETAKTIAQTAQAAAEAARTAAETAETSAGTSASQASQSATNAAQSATDAQHVLDSIPEDYTQMEADVADLKSQTDAMSTATATDVGKALSPKTVTDGKVMEWKFVSVDEWRLAADLLMSDGSGEFDVTLSDIVANIFCVLVVEPAEESGSLRVAMRDESNSNIIFKYIIGQISTTRKNTLLRGEWLAGDGLLTHSTGFDSAQTYTTYFKNSTNKGRIKRVILSGYGSRIPDGSTLKLFVK